MNRKINIFTLALAVLSLALSSCNDQKTYAELLNDETVYVNSFLADQRVVGRVPADSVFEVGPNAPYYRLDDDGFLYMQVLNAGTPGNMARNDELLYFRFSRYNLMEYADGKLPAADGNEVNLAWGNASFRYGNYSLYSTYKWGTGVQTPLSYLPIDCEVNLVVKATYGFYDEQAYCVPFLYHINYYRPKN